MGVGKWGLGFGSWGLGVWGLGFGVWGLGFGVWGLGFGVWGLGFGVWGSGPLPRRLNLMRKQMQFITTFGAIQVRSIVLHLRHSFAIHRVDHPRPRYSKKMSNIESSSHRLYLLVIFRKSSPPQNRHLIVYFYEFKYEVDGFARELTNQ